MYPESFFIFIFSVQQSHVCDKLSRRNASRLGFEYARWIRFGSRYRGGYFRITEFSLLSMTRVTSKVLSIFMPSGQDIRSVVAVEEIAPA